MNTIRQFGAAMTVLTVIQLMFSATVLAFDEQNAAAPGITVTPATPLDSEGQAPVTLDLEGGTVVKPAEEGTEVYIPGLGNLGILPKMDFGLELLYGASEPKAVETQQDPSFEDLTIRGSLKHNF